MKANKIYTSTILLLFVLIFFSCKKDHMCYCSSKYADVKGFKINGTKKYAKQKCKEYESNGVLGYQTDGCEIKD